MKSEEKIKALLRRAIKWRDYCHKEKQPGFSMWARDADLLKWVLEVRSERKFLAEKKK